MVEPAVLGDVVERPGGPRLQVSSPIDDAIEAGSTAAPAHIGQGSRVTTSVWPLSRHSSDRPCPAEMTRISACAVASEAPHADCDRPRPPPRLRRAAPPHRNIAVARRLGCGLQSLPHRVDVAIGGQRLSHGRRLSSICLPGPARQLRRDRIVRSIGHWKCRWGFTLPRGFKSLSSAKAAPGGVA